MPLGRGLSPNANGGNLGSPSQKWNNLYVGTIYADYIPGVTISTRNTSYAIGAVASSTTLPSYYRLVCVKDGITGAQEPTWPTPLAAGMYVADGTVIWIIEDVLDGTPVGRVVTDSILRPGYMRMNGASYSTASENYPRILRFLDANPSLVAADAAAYSANHGLWLYVEGTDTLTAPNYIDKVMEGAASVTELAAGLPNIKGTCFIVGQGGTYSNVSGAITANNITNGQQVQSSANSPQITGIDASKYNAIYSDSVTTVQMAAITGIPQCKY